MHTEIRLICLRVVVFFKALPQIAAHPDTKEVTIGSTAIFPCIATGYPVPNITWSKVTLIRYCTLILYIGIMLDNLKAICVYRGQNILFPHSSV